MSLEIVDYVIILFGGFVAGVINTFAGSGSIITLTILMELMGLDPLMANATNRVNILMMNVSSTAGFVKSDKLNLKGATFPLVALVLGAITGLVLLSFVSSDQFKDIFKYLLLLFLPIVLLKPSRLIETNKALISFPRPLVIVLFFIAGLYGGFIQMGIGIFILILTVSITKFDLMESNAFKVAAIGMYTLVALIVFQFQGLVVWKAGLLIGVAQSAGGFLTARYASQSPNANKWAYRILVGVLILAILRLFGIF